MLSVSSIQSFVPMSLRVFPTPSSIKFSTCSFMLRSLFFIVLVFVLVLAETMGYIGRLEMRGLENELSLKGYIRYELLL